MEGAMYFDIQCAVLMIKRQGSKVASASHVQNEVVFATNGTDGPPLFPPGLAQSQRAGK